MHANGCAFSHFLSSYSVRQVEERKKAILEAEKERREAMLRRSEVNVCVCLLLVWLMLSC